MGLNTEEIIKRLDVLQRSFLDATRVLESGYVEAIENVGTAWGELRDELEKYGVDSQDDYNRGYNDGYDSGYSAGKETYE